MSEATITAGTRKPAIAAWLWQRVTDSWYLAKRTSIAWYKDDPFQNSAAISFYTIFSLPGLLVIALALAGFFFGREAVMDELSAQVAGLISADAAEELETIVEKAYTSRGSVLSSIVGIATLLFGATGVFYQIQQNLNRIWEVKAEPKRAIWKMIRARVFSFGLVLAIGFLLLVSLVISAVLAAVSNWVERYVSESLVVLLGMIDLVLSLGVITLLFAAIYKFLPDAKIRWREVWIGALVTAALFTAAKFLLGLWLGSTKPGSTYGAAGTVILIMLWVSYASMILLYGAHFTRVYAQRFGKRIAPARGAVSTAGE
jgi:membrane protein